MKRIAYFGIGSFTPLGLAPGQSRLYAESDIPRHLHQWRNHEHLVIMDEHTKCVELMGSAVDPIQAKNLLHFTKIIDKRGAPVAAAVAPVVKAPAVEAPVVEVPVVPSPVEVIAPPAEVPQPLPEVFAALQDLTKAQLLDFAQNFLELDVKPAMSKAIVMEAILMDSSLKLEEIQEFFTPKETPAVEIDTTEDPFALDD